MCGIVGLVGVRPDPERLQRAIDALVHRGPDGYGFYVDREWAVSLGHTRLAINDLEGGAQPLFTEDRQLVLVANGEIYDHEAIRRDLEERGHRFATASDSEVILHLYREYELGFLDHLRGEFAFLLLDRRRRRLLAVRDRLGIKPFCYHQTGGRTLFASEAKALFATGLVAPRIDPAAVHDRLCEMWPDSYFLDVCSLDPGCFMEIDLDSGSRRVHRYWDLDLPEGEDPDPLPDAHEYVAKLTAALDEAVGLRLRADVPVGIYLSGGVDSAAVAASAGRQHSGPLDVFTVSFPDSERFDELEAARHTADFLGARFHQVTCDEETLYQNLEDTLWHTERPLLNLNGVAKLLLSKLARKHVKVVLTGEGADELFLGYPRLFQDRRPVTSPPPHIRRIVDTLGFLPLQEHADRFRPGRLRRLRNLFQTQLHDQLRAAHPLRRLADAVAPDQVRGRTLLRKIQSYLIRNRLPNHLLTVLGDRTEMGNGIEGRPPFLDHHLVEFSRSIPDGLKLHQGIGKFVLREAARPRIPEEVYTRRKWGFQSPRYSLERGRHPVLDELVHAHLSDAALARGGLFDPSALRRRGWFERLPVLRRCVVKAPGMGLAILTTQMLQDVYSRGLPRRLADSSDAARRAWRDQELRPSDAGR